MTHQKVARFEIEAMEGRLLLSAAPTGMTPAQIRHAYGVDQLSFPVGNVVYHADGSAQTIAIVDAYNAPTMAKDLKVFDKQFGLPNTDAYGKFVLTQVAMGKPRVNAGWALETALDVEWAHAIAPKAHILLVEAKSATTGDLLSAINYARRQPGVVAVSLSWGGDESPFETYFDNYLTTPARHIGGSGIAGGVTFVCASGDNGAPASWPAVSPNVVAVGGTTLTTDAVGTWLAESAWAGSGGGVSVYEPVPTHAPDVAFNADPASGFSVYTSSSKSKSGGWRTVGGTSAGSPQWAALIALADQGRNLHRLGSFNTQQTLQALYNISWADFHDIVTGSNGYNAGPGYDLVTGRGTPIAQNLVPDLMNFGSLTSSQSLLSTSGSTAQSATTFPFQTRAPITSADPGTGVPLRKWIA